MRQSFDKPSHGILERVKLFDFFHKTDEQLPTERSPLGGLFTIFTIFLLLYLLLSEFTNYSDVLTEDVLTVDVRRGGTLQIHLDFQFLNLSCEYVAMDVVDGVSGETLEEAAHQIIKQRLSPDGVALSEKRQAELGKPDETTNEECQSCLIGVPMHHLLVARQRAGNACCNTCPQLRSFYTRFNIPQLYADSAPQCKVSIPYGKDEGCRVHGYLEVPRAKGDFHVAAGTGFGQAHDEHSHHMHAIDWKSVDKFNISHIIHSISFGPPIPGISNPLDKHTKIFKGLAQHSYLIQVVPTIFRQEDIAIRTNQFSFTEHYHEVHRTATAVTALPGVYFRYDVSPIMIQITEKERPLVDFITSICAIVGGIYVVFGILYSWSHKVITKTKKLK